MWHIQSRQHKPLYKQNPVPVVTPCCHFTLIPQNRINSQGTKTILATRKGLLNNVALKLNFFDPPTPPRAPPPHQDASSRMMTRPPLRYVTPDTDTPTL